MTFTIDRYVVAKLHLNHQCASQKFRLWNNNNMTNGSRFNNLPLIFREGVKLSSETSAIALDAREGPKYNLWLWLMEFTTYLCI